ncbi:alpha/beta hydrolase [Rhodococcus sp. NPDC058521]|uniref:alpha/beta hydrolase n=1 Tax=Rhodococcus sp. NPDC058521 TaxID=3346536 RepID=UPI00365F7795
MTDFADPSMILPVDPVDAVTRGNLDVYLPETERPAPCVLILHGLFAEPPEVMPRQSSFFRDYASHLARRGLVAAVIDHDLTEGLRVPQAVATVAQAVEVLRNQPEADGDEVGLWFFSGGGVLSYPFLAKPEPWLRCVELTYPMLPADEFPEWPTVDEVISGASSVPTYFTVVENEVPIFAPDQKAFVERAQKAGIPVTVNLVPGAEHGFDVFDERSEARDAVAAGIDWIVKTLG